MKMITTLGELPTTEYARLMHHFEDSDGEGLTNFEMVVLVAKIVQSGDRDIVAPGYRVMVDEYVGSGGISPEGDILCNSLEDMAFLMTGGDKVKAGPAFYDSK